MSRKAQLEAAYKAVVDEISTFCSSNHLKVPTLVAVSKYHVKEDIQTLYDLGHRDFGENYVQELTQKAKELPQDIRWHFIGNLQTNKTKIAGEIPSLSTIETVDSEAKATRLNRQRGELPPLEVYIQVNTSREPQKAGLIESAEIHSLASHILAQCPALTLKGLMTIGALGQSQQSTAENADFAALVDARKDLETSLDLAKGSLELSMGMSSDYLEAIRQGSTSVRVGSKIFGPRPSKEEVKNNA